MTQYTDAAAAAAELREAHEVDGSPGVTRDALVEARINADWLHERALRHAVDLDAFADDLGLFPDDVNASLRDAQRRMQEIGEWAERFADALDAEIETIGAEVDAS